MAMAKEGDLVASSSGDPHLGEPINKSSFVYHVGTDSPKTGGINSMKQDVKLKQMKTLKKFMLQSYVTGLTFRFKNVLVPTPGSHLNSNYDEKMCTGLNMNKRENLCTFLERVMSRSRATRLQFKLMCVMCIKFLRCCTVEKNFMVFLKYDLRKLMLASLILTASTCLSETVELYARCSGLREEEINNCCLIVRDVLEHRASRQSREIDPSGFDSHTNTPLLSQIDERRVINSITVNQKPHDRYDNKNTDCCGYILRGELKQFNEMSKDLIYQHFTVG